MPSQVRCPSCGRNYSVVSQLEGKSLRCPGCENKFRYSSIGRYQILEELGRGAFGVVYRVFDPKMEREAAIKVLHTEIAQTGASKETLHRFRNEAKILAQIVHPNILPLYEADQHEGRLYLVTALIRGRPLDKHLSPHGPLDPRRVVSLVEPLLKALHYVHTTYGICHRDVKPANVMVGDGDSVYLMDFGLAVCHDQDTSRITTNGTTLGTPSFMPPEQAEGDLANIGPHSDQYSAGIVLFYLLTGQVPFRKPWPAILTEILSTAPPRPSSLRPELGPELDGIVLRALEKNPRARYPDCRAFADALRGWSQGSIGDGRLSAASTVTRSPGDVQKLLSSATILAPSVSAPTTAAMVAAPSGFAPAPVVRKSSRVWIILAIGILLTMALLAVLGYFLFGKSHSPTTPTTIRKGEKSVWEGD